MVQDRNDIVGLDAGILMHPQVWVTSGHVGSFSDPLVDCRNCGRRSRADRPSHQISSGVSRSGHR